MPRREKGRAEGKETGDPVHRQLHALVVKSEGLQLQEDGVKKVKALLKHNNTNVKLAFEWIRGQLACQDSEVRFRTLLLCDVIFVRSHYFRLLLTRDLSRFTENTVGHKLRNPLPPPEDVAELLREKAVEIVNSWFGKYGRAYRQLAIAYHHLSVHAGVLFPAPIAARPLRQQEQDRRQEHTRHINQRRIEKALAALPEKVREAERLCTEIESALQIIFPASFEEFVITTTTTGAANLPTGADLQRPVARTAAHTPTHDLPPFAALPGKNGIGRSGDAKVTDLRKRPGVWRAADFPAPEKPRPDLEIQVGNVLSDCVEGVAAVRDTLRDCHAILTKRTLPAFEATYQTLLKSDDEPDTPCTCTPASLCPAHGLQRVVQTLCRLRELRRRCSALGFGASGEGGWEDSVGATTGHAGTRTQAEQPEGVAPHGDELSQDPLGDEGEYIDGNLMVDPDEKEGYEEFVLES